MTIDIINIVMMLTGLGDFNLDNETVTQIWICWNKWDNSPC